MSLAKIRRATEIMDPRVKKKKTVRSGSNVQDVERVYTVNLGKVLLSPDNQRAKRAVNMIKEFARHHLKIEQVKIEEDVSHLLWARGIKHPPRKIRVRMTKTDEGYVLVSKYEGEEESIEKEEEKTEPQKVEPSQVEPEKEEQSLKVEPEPAAKPEPKPAAKPDDVPEFFKKKDEEKKRSLNQSLRIKNFILTVLNQVHSQYYTLVRPNLLYFLVK